MKVEYYTFQCPRHYLQKNGWPSVCGVSRVLRLASIIYISIGYLCVGYSHPVAMNGLLEITQLHTAFGRKGEKSKGRRDWRVGEGAHAQDEEGDR